MLVPVGKKKMTEIKVTMKDESNRPLLENKCESFYEIRLNLSYRMIYYYFISV